MKVEALFISDVHLGSTKSKAEDLLETLNKIEPEVLFIVGDLFHLWQLTSIRWSQDEKDVISKIIHMSKNGTKVIYIPGNHDEFLRSTTIKLFTGLLFKNIEIHNHYVWNETFITHGDLFSAIKGLGFTNSQTTEAELIFQAKLHGCKNVISGHSHLCGNRIVDGVRVMNTGDWVLNKSYIVYNKGVFNLTKLYIPITYTPTTYHFPYSYTYVPKYSYLDVPLKENKKSRKKKFKQRKRTKRC